MISCVAIVVPFKINNDNSISYWMQSRVSGEFAGLREFPGGKLDPNESIIECAIREVYEETGVTLAQSDLKHLTTKSITLPNKKISMAIFLTDRIELFLSENIIRITDCSKLETQLKTLPANYEIISEIHSYLLG